jgi:hypothetical protein
MAFYGQFNTDYYISKYFPTNYVGTCIDVGMGEPIIGNNTFHFEQKGWVCLCIEPNIKYYNQAIGVRKLVENIAISNINNDNIDFTIFNINENNESAKYD